MSWGIGLWYPVRPRRWALPEHCVSHPRPRWARSSPWVYSPLSRKTLQVPGHCCARCELAWCLTLRMDGSWSLPWAHRLLQPCHIWALRKVGVLPQLGRHNFLHPGAPVPIQLIHTFFFNLPIPTLLVLSIIQRTGERQWGSVMAGKLWDKMCESFQFALV